MIADDKGILKGALGQELAAEFNVDATIFERDYLINALVWALKGDFAAAYRQYIADGRANAELVRDVIKTYCGERLQAAAANASSPPLTVLDFACGYGRVGRHFRNVMPEVKYVGMDIHRDAIRFNRDVLGLETLLSSQASDQNVVLRTFDVICALSFFSHVRHEHFLGWLTALHAMMKPGGILMFTTHGRTSQRLLMPEVVVNPDGYGMIVASEQYDLSTDYYVHAVTYREYVERMIGAVNGLQILNYSEGSWFGHQDMFVVKNIKPVGWGPRRMLKLAKAKLKRLANREVSK